MKTNQDTVGLIEFAISKAKKYAALWVISFGLLSLANGVVVTQLNTGVTKSVVNGTEVVVKVDPTKDRALWFIGGEIVCFSLAGFLTALTVQIEIAKTVVQAIQDDE